MKSELGLQQVVQSTMSIYQSENVRESELNFCTRRERERVWDWSRAESSIDMYVYASDTIHYMKIWIYIIRKGKVTSQMKDSCCFTGKWSKPQSVFFMEMLKNTKCIHKI